jgi:hypothetical protein
MSERVAPNNNTPAAQAATQEGGSRMNQAFHGTRKQKRVKRITEAAYWRRRLKNATSDDAYENAESDMQDCAVDERNQNHTVNVSLTFDDGSEFDTDTLENIKKLNAAKRKRISQRARAHPKARPPIGR